SLSGRGQVAVADCGIGLKRSLERNTSLTVTNDRDAIDLALTPWTSGNAESMRGMYGSTGNTGNGLSMVRNLTESIGGELLVISGWACFHEKPGGAVTHDSGVWPGTIVAVEFPVNLPVGFEALKVRALRALGDPPRRRRKS